MDQGVRRIRIGIRGKLLAFLGIAVIFILAMEMVAQRASLSLSEEYATRLNQYHLVHRTRIALQTFRSDTERFLREPGFKPVEALYEQITALSALDDSLSPLEEYSIEAGFEVRATGYGLDAYFPLVARSISLRVSGKSDYYLDFARAERIADFIDTYLSRLLSILMRDGEASFLAASRKYKAINDAILFGTIAAGLLLLMYVYFVANSITRPIRKLARASEKLARGDLDVEPIKTASKDEVGILTESFFAMSMSIRSHIESLREKAELERKLREEETSLLSMGQALREAQLMNLQDQMRPHFLFNALNSIARNALLEKAPATEKLTISLARLLRSTIKEGGTYISLGEELEIVREYLSFQKVRFGERLDWDIQFDPSLGGEKIPRFLLQPLVENAVRHGSEPKPEKTRILVSVKRRGEKLKAFVLDTGAGMKNGELAALRKKLEGPRPISLNPGHDGGSGIGLANVATRLFILYGTESSLHVYSKPGKGTIVSLGFPLKGFSKWPES